MFVIRIKTFSDIRELGSQRRTSVVRPRGIMPDLSFKAPTCVNRDSSFSSARQGGYFYLAVDGPNIV